MLQIDPTDIVTMGGPLAAFYATIEGLKHFGYKKAKNGGGFSSDDKSRLARMETMVVDLKQDNKDSNTREIRQEILTEQLTEHIKAQTATMAALPTQIAQAIRDSR